MESKVTAPPMLENDLLNLVIDYARVYGWLVVHFRSSRTKHGWSTAVSADGAGFPDLVLVHPGRQRVVWVELKREHGKLSNKQRNWRAWLLAAGQEWHMWQPSDWSEIEQVLGRKEEAE